MDESDHDHRGDPECGGDLDSALYQPPAHGDTVPLMLALVPFLIQAAPPETLTIVERLGLIGLLLVILIGGSRGWWVFGKVHADLLAAERRRAEAAELREAEWKAYAMRSIQAGEAATQVARQVTRNTG